MRLFLVPEMKAVIGLLTFSLAGLPAAAHQAPSGWSYPVNCCSNHDCREVASDAISERTEGYIIGSTGEVIGYGDFRVKDSPDGAYHWCSAGGLDNSSTICLFVPPQAY